MRHAYIYYRVAPAQASQAASRVDTLLQALAAHCTQPPRRLARCDDAATWMEVYEGIADWPAFEAAMQAALKALQLDVHIDGARHLECFVASADTA